MNKVIISILISFIFTISVFIYINNPRFGNVGNVGARSCVVSETLVPVGHQLATTLLSANGRRAWASIQQPINATNTVQIDFGGTAVFGSGSYQLTNATTTSPVNSIEFGLGTNFPYTGSVTAITQSASSTVNVIQCVY